MYLHYAAITLAVVLVFLAPTLGHAQDSTEAPLRRDNQDVPAQQRDASPHVKFRIGLFGGVAFNVHETDATVFSGGGECGAFRDGNGQGPFAGLLFELPVLDFLPENFLDGGLDALLMVGFVQRGGKFGEVIVTGLPILDPLQNTYTTLERRHTYTASLGYLQADLGARFTPFAGYPGYVRVVGGIGYPLLTPSHVQNEEIISPMGVVYPETNQTIREVSSGTIRDVGPSFSVGGGVGYPLPLAKNLTVSPEIAYYHPLSDVTPFYKWRISGVHAGVVLRYSFVDTPPEIPPPPPPPPVAEVPEPPRVAVAAVAAQKIAIEETIVTETFPILPYIFFDSARAEILPRYTQMDAGSTANFNEKNLPHRSLTAYYHIMNVIGSRMRSNGDARITLNGATDGRESAVLGTPSELALDRAKAVQQYLVDVWGIASDRIKLSATSLPSQPSNMEYAEGDAENRRVEIRSNDDYILQPIMFERFSEYGVTPSSIPFTLQASSASGIARWRLDVYAGGNRVWERTGTGTPPSTVEWPLDVETGRSLSRALARGDGSLRCELSAVARNEASASAVYAQRVTSSLSPFEISRLSLIVFDFDKADINTQNRRMISTFVSGSLQKNSTSSIVGSTDRLGEIEHNQQLSQERAVAVRDLVVAERPAANITRVEGIGASRLIYDNNLPEGRYYCRTVTVEVKTPIAAEASGK